MTDVPQFCDGFDSPVDKDRPMQRAGAAFSRPACSTKLSFTLYHFITCRR
jgi:hypothetical protein